jgi:uncharacterized SAM-dependent methyltransferase
MLIGADLKKDANLLHAAYNDSRGVTAAFNLNLLTRINRELGANFDLRSFQHRAVWNARCSRMEMFVVAQRPQRVHIPMIDLELDLAEGEAIWTESSYKYTPQALSRQLEAAGFESAVQWIDRENGVALSLAQAC